MRRSTVKKLVAITLMMLVVIIGYWLSRRNIEQIAETNQLAEKSKVFEELLDIKKEALVSVNNENQIVGFSGDKSIFGYTEQELIGQRFDILFHCDKSKIITVMVGQCVAQNKNNEKITVKNTLTTINKDDVKFVVSFQRE